MAISLFAKFYKIKDTQLAVESDAAMLALPNGTILQKITGDEYVKVSTNVFDKSNRDFYSREEADGRFFRLNFENTGTENNYFTKDIDVKGNTSTGTLQVAGTSQLHDTSATNITANNVDLTNKITSPNGDIDTIQSKNVIPYANRTGTVGTAARTWATAYINEMYGTAQHARYSDLAEKYETDQEYEPGTVLQFSENGPLTMYRTGGTLAGVVSTNPGLKINSDGKGQYVCLKGMIPVKCWGEVKRGQCCVAVDGGLVAGTTKEHASSHILDFVGIALKDSEDGMVLVKV